MHYGYRVWMWVNAVCKVASASWDAGSEPRTCDGFALSARLASGDAAAAAAEGWSSEDLHDSFLCCSDP